MLRPASLAFLIAMAAAPALAGPFDGWLRPPGTVGAGAARPVQDDAMVGDLLARVQRLEGENRQLTGQVEELQNLLRRSQDDFKHYRDDTEYRLQSLEGGGGKAPAQPQKRSETVAPAPGPASQSAAAAPPASNRGAPPRSLGTLPTDQDLAGGDQQDFSGQPGMAQGGGAPQDAGQHGPGGNDAAALDRDQGGAPMPPRRVGSGLAPPGLPGVAVDTSAPLPGQAGGSQMASLPQTSEDEYTVDYRLLEGQNYEAAELAFRKFVSSYPKDKRIPDALHWIGESLYQRQQYRDAAEEFLKVTTTYGSSRRAPSSMLKLGMSLAALGEKDAACATLQELPRKYPAAPPAVKTGADRELKKNSC